MTPVALVQVRMCVSGLRPSPRLQYVLKEPVIVGVFRVVLHFASPLQALANVLVLLLPTLFVCGSLTPAPPRTALQSLKSGRKKKMGTPNPKKPLHGAPPPLHLPMQGWMN